MVCGPSFKCVFGGISDLAGENGASDYSVKKHNTHGLRNHSCLEHKLQESNLT